MVGKNNKFLKENKNNQRFLRFSLRKLSVGVVSVAIAAGFYIGGSQSVLADTTSNVPVVNDNSAETTDKNKVNLQNSDSSAVASTANSTAAEAGKSAAPAASSAAEAGKSAAPAASSAAEQQKMAMFNVAKAKSAATSNTANLLDKKVQSNAASDTAKAEEDQLADKLLKNIKISDPTDSNFARYQGYVDKYNNQTTDTSSQYVFSVIRDYYGYDFIWTIDRDTGSKVFVYLAAKYGRGYEEIRGYAQFSSNGDNFPVGKDGNIILNYTPKTDSESGSINVAAQDGNHLTAVYGLGTPVKSFYSSLAELLPEKGQPIIKFLYKDPNSDGKLVNLRKPIYCKEGLTGQSFVLDTSNYANDISDYTKNDKAFDGFTLEPNKNNDDNKIFEGTFTQFDQGKTYVKYYKNDDSEVIYQQLDASGTMKVDYYKDVHSHEGPRFVGSIDRLETGKSQEIIDDATGVTMTVRNPFVSGSHSYEFIYNPDPQTGKIIYQDADNNNVEVDHTDLNGKTTQHVTVNPQIPDGYEIIPGQSIPKTRTATSNGIPDVIVNVRHHKITVTPGQEPNPGDKKLGNTSKKPGDGTPKTDVSYETLHRNMTRTINVTDPHAGLTTTTKVTLNYERIATIDDVTGDVTYGTWTVVDGSESGFDAFTIPDVPGYTSKIKTGTAEELEALTPNQDQITNWQDQIVDIDYTANEQTGKISYVDGNRNEVSHTDLAGKTGNTINVNPQAPIDWKIVPGQSIPKTVVAGSDGIPTVTVQVEHDTITVTPDQPKNPSDKLPDGKNYPSGVTKDDLNKTISRKITINVPNKPAQVINQKADFTRTATIDLVNHKVTYGDWILKDSTLEAVDAPAVPGYTPNVAHVDGIATPTVDTPLSDITVNYKADDQNQVVNYVDQNGKVIKSDTITGKTDQTVNVTPSVPDHYELVPGQNIPSEVTLKDKNTPIIVKVQSKVDSITDPAKLNKSISRTITINKPGEKPQVINQYADFTRTGQHNEVTGEDVYTDWTLKGNTLEAVDAPAVPGYTPNVAHVDGVENPTADTKLANVVINYSADDQTQVINYVDDHNKTIKTDMVKGETDETVKVTPNVPDHYELVPGQEIPGEVTLKDKNTPIIVKVQPKMDSITDPAKLNKSISRTITINKLGEKPQVINQHADFTRTGQYNEVTGATIYTDWALKDSTLEAVDAPAVPGYTPNVAHVDGVKNPTADTKLNDVVINYTADDQNQVVNYVDQNGKVIKSDTITGQTDQTVDVNVKVPDHYELVNGQNIPENVTLKTNNPVINIQVTPKMDDITAPSQLTKAISRTITINVPHQTPIVENQSANFTRTGQHNEVTGEDVYTGWTLKGNSLRHVDVPAVPGYTPSQKTVDGIATPAVDTPVSDITVNYTANEQTGQITYVDEKGNQISSTPLTGKTDDNVAINPVAPAGWELVPGQKYPAKVTANPDGIPGVTLTVRHHMINVVPGDVPTPGDKKPGNPDKKPGDGTPKTDVSYETLHRNMTRTINVTDPHAGLTTTTKVTLNYERIATIDDVTGDVTYGTWTVVDGSESGFDAFTIPDVPGYTSKIKTGTAEELEALTPNQDQITNWQDQIVDIDYTANEQTGKISYVDGNRNEVSHTDLAGKTGNTINVNPQAPIDWKIVPGQSIPKTVVAGSDGIPTVTVQVEHDTITVTPDQPKNPSDKLPDGTNYPAGVDQNDLNHDVVRTINITKPGKTTTTTTQKTSFNRTATIDLVDHSIKYGNWVQQGDNGWKKVDVPVVNGYTPSVQNIDKVAVTPDTEDATIDVTYTANGQTGAITYVDEKGNKISSTLLTGKTDQDVDVKGQINVPTNWKIVPGQTIPDTVKATADGIPTVTVNIEHDTITVNPGDPKKPSDKLPDGTNYPAGVDQNDLNHDVVRTINITKPGKTTTTTTQKTSFNRTATIDLVDHSIKYGNWVQQGDNGWKKVDVPVVNGYTPSVQNIDKVAVTPDTKDATIDVTYMANDQTGAITYVDREGNTIDTTPLTGKTDDNVTINPVAPAGWKIIAGQQIPTTVKATANGIQGPSILVEHDTTTVKPGDLPNPGDKKPGNPDKKPGDKTPKTDITYNDLHKAMTRTINVTDPHTGLKTTKVTLNYERTATIDDVTGKVTYGNWTVAEGSKAGFDGFNVPAVPGYTSEIKSGSAADLKALTPSQDQITNWTDQTVDIDYTANDQSLKITYVDKAGNPVDGGIFNVSGKTDQTVDTKAKIPAGWVLEDGQTDAPKTITFTGTPTADITITVEHGTKRIPHDNPVKPGDKTPSGKEIKGAHDEDLNQTITRTIKITEPGKATKTTTQVAHIYRDATVDDVTGEVTYSAWSTDSADWTAVNVPSHAGYTAHQSDGKTVIPAVMVKDGQKDVNIDVTYTPDDQKGQITYVDEKGNQISSIPLTGKTDQDVDVKGKINVPANWELVPGQTIPDTVKATADGIPTVTVKVQPKMDSITDPAKLNKSISRTITINKPGEKPQVINQHADFTRTGQYNEVTGTTIYTDWALKDSTLEAVDAPAVPGYTPNVAHVDGVKNPTADTKLNDVVINYTADDQNQVVNYVDQNGKVIKSDTITGQTDQTVDVNVKVPDHYELVNGQNIPENVTLKTNNPVINIQVTPKMDDITAPSQLTKAISRTITINVPHQTPIVENQSANFTRTGQHNEVTGEDVYTGWTLKGNSLRHVDVPAVPGYTPSQKTVDGIATPAVDTPVSDITVNYTANEQTGQITYVDEKGNQISSTPLTGKTDENIAINPVAPAGWELVPGQKYPATVTATADGIPGVTLTVRHHMINVVPGDVPTPGNKKPGNSDKKPGDGTPNKDITHENLNKTITRTFIVKAPTGTMTKTQHISYQRTATIDDVTGDVTFSDWNTDGASFKAEVIPAISGYTSHVTEGNYGAYAPSQDQINNWTDPMITVTYTANDQSQVINYVDDHNKTVKTDTVHGKTDETVNVTPSVPDHYELVPGQNIPSEVTLKDKNTPIIVKVQPKVDSITDPAKLNKSISRTITINKPGEKPQVINQHADFTRTGQYNEVTGTTIYTDWALKDSTLEAVDAPAVPGYTPNVAHVDGVENPTADTKLANVVINYSADDQTQKIDYVDPNGKVVKTDTVKGKTDETVKVTPNIPDHYELVSGQNIPSEVTLKDKNTPIIVKVQPKVDSITDPAKLNKSISRTITINKPGEKPQVINQTATFKRTGKTNEVTGITTYTPWVLDQNGLTTVSAPEVPGYTPSQKTVASVDNPTANTKLTDVTINYTANSQTTHINYVDKDGKTIKSDTVSGKTDQNVKTNSEVPAGWKIIDGQVPETIYFKGEGTPDTTITIEHDTTSVDHTKPIKPGDKTPSGKEIKGAHESDLNQTITRTINVTTPDGQTTTTKQVAKIYRDATIDDVTGEVTYGDWSEGTWTDFKPGQVAGYTASPADVPAVTVKDGQKDQTVNISYAANDQTTHINYVDKDDHKKTIKTDTVHGKTGQNVKTNSEVPAGWKIIDGQVPETIHFKGEGTPDTTITIEHDTTSVDHTKPIKPGDKTPSGKEIKGAHESDLNQTITRTINVTTPDGQTTTTKQVAKIYRDATIDDVTGEVTYGDWSEGTWTDFKPGQVAGYTASPADVPAVTVKDGQKDQTVDITYTANEGTVLIKYVDRDGNEIGQQVITGHVGDTIKVTPQFPENWVPVDPDTVPAEVQIKEENGQIIIVVVRHAEKDPVQTKKVTRTITVTTPDGQTKTIKQVVTISRHGDLDLVTGQIAWQPWTTAQWDVFKPAAIAGYTPSLAEVPAVTVDGETTDQTVDITYAAVATPAQPEHQAPTASDTTDAQRATNQKADSNAQPAVTVVTSQQTATAQQAESTTNSRRLPQTGNSHDASALAGLGLASLMGLFGLGGKRRKRD